VTWSSSNPARLSVNASGSITGLSEGSATITAQYQSFTLTLGMQVSGTFVQRTIVVAGQGARRYTVYQPAGASGPRPAFIAMHGGGGSAQNFAETSLMVSLAQQNGIYLALPEGTGFIQTFNAGACCGTAQTQNVDDVAFVSAVLDDLLARDPVDAARIYATGFSNGGMMSHRLACAMSTRIAGIAAVGGASGQFDQARSQFYSCNPSRPIPVLHIHATNDRNYPYQGGAGDDTASGVAFYPVDATITDWLTRNNVTSVAVVENVTPTTSCRRYATVADTSRPSAPVALCRVDPPDVFDAITGIVHGGGHSWPGGLRGPGTSSDTPLVDFNANSYLWSVLSP
jgi:polyhydroxybutyrate depolymerase